MRYLTPFLIIGAAFILDLAAGYDHAALAAPAFAKHSAQSFVALYPRLRNRR
jgi:hypothetical protein